MGSSSGPMIGGSGVEYGSGGHVPNRYVIRKRFGCDAVGDPCCHCSCRVDYGCAFSSEGFTNIEHFLGFLRGFLEDSNVSISVIVKHKERFSECVVWNVASCCESPCQRVNNEAAFRATGAHGGG